MRIPYEFDSALYEARYYSAEKCWEKNKDVFGDWDFDDFCDTYVHWSQYCSDYNGYKDEKKNEFRREEPKRQTQPAADEQTKRKIEKILALYNDAAATEGEKMVCRKKLIQMGVVF